MKKTKDSQMFERNQTIVYLFELLISESAQHSLVFSLENKMFCTKMGQDDKIGQLSSFQNVFKNVSSKLEAQDKSQLNEI